MKVFMFFMLVAAIHLSANSYSQNTKISLDMNNVTIKQVLQEIENQTEFRFLYSDTKIDVEQKVNVNIENSSIQEIFKTVFDEAGIIYEIRNRQILLSNANPVIALQNIKVTGKVTDSTGAPLPGVTVVVKGTTNGAITNFDGVYSLSNVPSDGIIQFSFVGMKMQEILVDGKTSINIVMEEDAIGIEEVVAIGYGTMKKSDLTGSVASVKSEELSAYPTTDVMQALAGRASGVQVMQNNGSPGSPVSIRIRGVNSILGDNEPLYVIDGFPGDIQFLNPGDIESVEILKDASATAIYGSQGANGVVLVTTKKGKSGRTTINFESSYSLQQLIKKMDMMNAEEYCNLYYIEKQINDGAEPAMTEYEIQELVNEVGEGTDWQKEFFRIAPIQNYQLSLSGGTDKTDFLISGNLYDHEGIIQNSGYKRYSLRSRINHKVNDKLSVKHSIFLTQTHKKTNGLSEGDGDRLLFNLIARKVPVHPAFNEDGTVYRGEDESNTIGEEWSSPYDYIKNSSNEYKRNNLNASLALEYKLTPELSFKIGGNINYMNYRRDYFRNSNFVGILTSSYASITVYDSYTLNSESLITYKKKINNIHSINAVAGVTTTDYTYKYLNSSAQGFLSDVYETSSLQSGETSGTPSSSYQKSNILSYLGRLNYSYKDKYLVTVSMRADGSSRFNEGNKWGYFPSGAFAWKLNQEDFLKDNPTISDMKLRLGWGVTGSQAIGIYATQVLLTNNKMVLDDSYQNAMAPSTTLPGNLKWETTEQINAGIDIGIIKNRFRLTVDYYQKKTKDLLNKVSLPVSMGWTTTYQNVGEIENKGLEFNANAVVLDRKFKWNLSGNLSFNRNKVVKLYGGQDIQGSAYNLTLINDFVNILSEGHSMGAFYGYMEDGYDDSGNIKYLDINEDGSISSADKTFIGDPNPKFTYGLNSDFSFNNFTLNIFFQGTYGNDLFNLSSISNTIYFASYSNLLREVYYDHWTPENTDAKYPIPKYATSAKISDRFVEDGSYLRLKNIQLGYNLPVKKFGINWLKKLNLSVSGQNLITFTKYSWWDPDVNSSGGGNSINQGLDWYTYPSNKSITFSLKATF